MTVTTISPSVTAWNAWATDGRDYRVITDTELIHFARHVPVRRGGVAVDVGCGTGAFSRQLYRFGYDVTGVDFADEALHAARRTRLPGVRYLHHDLNRGDPPGLAQHSIDLVVGRLVLPYLDQPYGWVKRVREHWLRPGGRLYLVIPVVDGHADKPGGMTDPAIEDIGQAWGSVIRYTLRGSLACLVLRTAGT